MLAALFVLGLCACQPRTAPPTGPMPTASPPPTATPSPRPTPTGTPAPTGTPTPTLRPPLACAEPGTQQRGRAEAPSRGWPYSYQIYLPPCYSIETDRRYPVIYLLPGVNGGPGQWFAGGAAAVADEVILSVAVPPFILVGTESASGDPDGDVIFADLVPAIEAQYRALGGRQHRAVAGASLGGSAAYRLAFGHPDHFASMALFGAGLISGDEPRLQAWLEAQPPERQPRAFFNSGLVGDPLMVERAQVMVDTLTEAGLTPTVIFTEGRHDYGYWMTNLPAYFEWVAADW